MEYPPLAGCIGITDTQCIIENLEDGVTYYWYVTASDQKGGSASSSQISFTVSSSAVIDQSDDNAQIQTQVDSSANSTSVQTQTGEDVIENSSDSTADQTQTTISDSEETVTSELVTNNENGGGGGCTLTPNAGVNPSFILILLPLIGMRSYWRRKIG